jgi:hypothetical protein
MVLLDSSREPLLKIISAQEATLLRRSAGKLEENAVHSPETNPSRRDF